MSRNWRGMFADLLGRADSHNPERRKPTSKKEPLGVFQDEETLTEEVPYKLEPDLEAVEQYLNRIRQQGL